MALCQIRKALKLRCIYVGIGLACQNLKIFPDQLIDAFTMPLRLPPGPLKNLLVDR